MPPDAPSPDAALRAEAAAIRSGLARLGEQVLFEDRGLTPAEWVTLGRGRRRLKEIAALLKAIPPGDRRAA